MEASADRWEGQGLQRKFNLISGKRYVSPEAGSFVTAPMPSNFIIGRLDKAGNVKELKYVNKEEYDRVKKRIGA